MNKVSTEPATATWQGSITPVVADRYRTIPHSMSQAFCVIDVLFDEHNTAVDYRFLEVNVAFAQQSDLGNPVGRTMRELAPQHEALWYELYGEVVRTGQPAHFEQRAQYIGDYWYEVYALPTGPPGSQQVAVLFTDITARRHTEEALRSSQDRQAFLLRLSDALRPLAAPTAIAEVACRLLVGQLAASRVQYTLVEGGPEAQLGWAAGEDTEPGQRLASSFPLASYVEPLIALLRANETLVLTDTGRDPRLTPAQREAFLAVASPAMIAVPLVKEGLFVAVLTVHVAAPRPWTPHEVRLVEEVAERTWAAVERARAEAVLRAKEQQQAFLVQLADELRALPGADEIQAVAVRLLGQHLGANQVHYGETQGEDLVIQQGYGDGLPAMTGRFRALDFGEQLIAALRAGVVQVVRNIDTATTVAEAERQVLRAARIGAYIKVPLLKAGQWVVTLGVHSIVPRLWSPEEVHLVQEVAERTWAAVERARAEAALRQLEEQFRLFVTTSSDVVYRMSADWQQMLHLNGKRFLADTTAPHSTWLDTYIFPEDQAVVGAAIQAAIAGLHFFELEHRVFQADGSVGWTFSRAVPVFGPQGELSAWFGTATNITTRKLAEAALRESEQRLAEFNAKLEQQVAARTHDLRESRDLLHAIADSQKSSISAFKALRDEYGRLLDLEYIFVNSGVGELDNRRPLVGQRFLEVFPEWQDSRYMDTYRSVIETGVNQDREVFYNDGQRTGWFRNNATKLGDGVLVVGEDITARKLAEQERTRNMRLLEQAENVAQLGSWDYDLATGQFLWSAGMYQLFGLPQGQVIRPSIYLDYVVDEDRAQTEQLVHRLTTAAGDFEQTIRLRVGEQVKTVRIKVSTIPSAEGQPVRVLGVDLDISELQRLEADNLGLRLSQQQVLFEAMQEAQEEERRRMSESLHNGIGQLLYATKLQLDSLPDAPAASPRHEAARLLSEAIRQTRTLSHELTPALLEEFGLEATLQGICRTLSQAGLHWHCHLVFEEGPALPLSLQLAVYRLAQELAQNVVKHAQASQATLEAEVLPAWVVLRVEDNGRGFDPTHTSDGLGLRSLRSRVALLGGRLKLTTAPGQGTQCQIRLPLMPTPL